MTLENLTLAQLVVLHNVLAAKSVKKFASKADAIKRIGALEAAAEDIDVWQARFDGAYAEILKAAKVETVEDAAVETPEETVIVPDAAVEGGEAPVELPAVEITEYEYRVLDAIAHSQWSPVNCATPTTLQETGTWYYADVMADETGLTEQQIGGVSTSLQSKGLITIHIEKDPKESTVDFTELGFSVWDVNFQAKGTLPRLETPPVDAPVSAPVTSGFQYKTRDELKALAETDAEARAAYRVERRKAARAARKAKKAKAA